MLLQKEFFRLQSFVFSLEASVGPCINPNPILEKFSRLMQMILDLSTVVFVICAALINLQDYRIFITSDNLLLFLTDFYLWRRFFQRCPSRCAYKWNASVHPLSITLRNRRLILYLLVSLNSSWRWDLSLSASDDLIRRKVLQQNIIVQSVNRFYRQFRCRLFLQTRP